MQVFYYVFGAITLGAAVQGYLAGSPISLIAGGILGLLILAGCFLFTSNATVALILALVGLLGIAGRFVPAFFKSNYQVWPAGTLAVLSVIGLILTVVALVKK